MRMLALETATSSCTVAVTDGETLLAESTLTVPRAHSTRLMPLISRAVKESGLAKPDLDAIAVGVGPGSFTGLRIGLATAKGVSLALGKPCVPVSTLLAMAYGTCAQIGLVVPMLDAKRGEVFGAVYAAGDRDPATWAELLPPCHIAVAELAERVAELRTGLRHTWQFVTVCGDVAQQYGPQLGSPSPGSPSPGSLDIIRQAAPGAVLPRGWAVAAVGRSVAARGGAVEPDALVPIYLRRSEAETLWEARKSPSSQ